MTYEQIIEWISRRYSAEGYDFFSVDSLNDIRQQLVRDFDKDGRLDHFLFGNDKFTITRPNIKWGGIEGTNVERQLFENIERPLIEEFNANIEESLGGEIESAGTTDELADIDIPNNLAPETIDRLEEAKNLKFGEIRSEEIKEEITSPETELSRFKQITKEIKRLPDEAVRQDLSRDLREEAERLKELNQSFLEQIRTQTDEFGLDRIIRDIDVSDLREKQKESLQRIAEARRDLGFPEITSV